MQFTYYIKTTLERVYRMRKETLLNKPETGKIIKMLIGFQDAFLVNTYHSLLYWIMIWIRQR